MKLSSAALGPGDQRSLMRAQPMNHAWLNGRSSLWLVIVLLVVFVAMAAVSCFLALHWRAANGTIAMLEGNRDVAVPLDSEPDVLLARVAFLVSHERVDEASPYVEALDRSRQPAASAAAHYNVGNGRLRQAFDLLTQGKLDDAGPKVILARQAYRRALTLVPGDWDAKYNLDVASRLIRDFPAFERTDGDTLTADPKRIWTDIPGKPEGLP
ncbi:MxaK protein [Labrys sp. WJW]|uniref:MxaK protein n=1 Tax=Labrys sp. WJW TaxID=1737983 RepID=UPI000B0AC247|nr:MxaK protein [Labrys sp. WJW]